MMGGFLILSVFLHGGCKRKRYAYAMHIILHIYALNRNFRSGAVEVLPTLLDSHAHAFRQSCPRFVEVMPTLNGSHAYTYMEVMTTPKTSGINTRTE